MHFKNNGKHLVRLDGLYDQVDARNKIQAAQASSIIKSTGTISDV
jgi:hypothetical protein